MATNIFIEAVILFVVIFSYLAVANARDTSNWLRALLLAVAIPILGLLPNYFGAIGWLIAIVLALTLISKSLGYSIPGSFLFLMMVGIVEYIIRLVIF